MRTAVETSVKLRSKARLKNFSADLCENPLPFRGGDDMVYLFYKIEFMSLLVRRGFNGRETMNRCSGQASGRPSGL